jgi:hypothetical protein
LLRFFFFFHCSDVKGFPVAYDGIPSNLNAAKGNGLLMLKDFVFCSGGGMV